MPSSFAYILTIWWILLFIFDEYFELWWEYSKKTAILLSFHTVCALSGPPKHESKLPTTFVVNPEGLFHYRFEGPITAQHLADVIPEL